jgi:hypothetical protein
MHSNYFHRTFVCVVLAASCIGCGRGDGVDRVMLSGTVTYDGQAVEVGQIRFIPQPGTEAPLTVEKINDGRYETETTGGVPVGTHRVEITGYDRENYENTPVGPGAAPPEQLLPPQYNRESDLTITLESGQGATTHDFELSP